VRSFELLKTVLSATIATWQQGCDWTTVFNFGKKQVIGLSLLPLLLRLWLYGRRRQTVPSDDDVQHAVAVQENVCMLVMTMT